MNQDAVELLLDEGSDAFREEYGDYFVAGYQYGGMYDAYITITTNTSDQLDKIKTELGAKISLMNASNDNTVSGDAKLSAETQEILKKYKAQITVEIKTIGAGATSLDATPVANSQDIQAMDSVIGRFTQFRNELSKSFSPTTYVPVHVMLKRYRSLSSARKIIEAYIPVPAEQSAQIMTFNRALLNMRGYYNVIGSLPSDQIDTSVRDTYSGKFYDIVNTIQAAGNSFYLSADQIAGMLPRVKQLSTELKEIGDRYTFYRMLVDAQEKEPSLAGSSIKDKPFGPGGGSTGYKSFGVSAAVTADLKSGGSSSMSSPYDLSAFKTWNPSINAGENKFISWIKVTAAFNDDTTRNVSTSPAVGKQKVSFSFASPFTAARTSGGWALEYQFLYMPRETYPFAGLKD